MIRRCVLEKKTLVASFVYDVLKFADVIIVDVQLDYSKNEMGNVRNGHVEMSALEESFDIIGRAREAGRTCPHRDDRCAGHDRAGGLARHPQDIQAPGHQDRSTSGPQLREGYAGEELRGLHT